MKNVLVPLDGTQAAEKALPLLQQVCTTNDTIVLFSVQKPKSPVMTGTLPGQIVEEGLPFVTPEVPVFAEKEEQTLARQTNETKDYLERLAVPLREAGFNVRTEVRLDEHAVEAITQFARDFKPAVIVLSRSPRLQPPERLFGSVATRLFESSVAPMLLIPSKA